MAKKIGALAILSLGIFRLFASLEVCHASDYVFPDTMAISATRTFDSYLVGTADTILVTLEMSNLEPDSMRNLYFGDHIPKGLFDVSTIEVWINGVLMSDTAYVHEVGLCDGVFSGTIPHRWVIESPPDSLGQRLCSQILDPSSGTLQIVYAARCTTAGDHWFPSYTWAGQLTAEDGVELFGYADSAFVFISDVPPPVADLTSVLSGGDVFLFWTAPSHPVDIDHYVVYRDTVPGFHSIGGDSVGITADTFYTDSGVGGIGNPGLNLYYLVRSVDLAGKESEDSNCAGEFDKDLVNVK